MIRDYTPFATVITYITDERVEQRKTALTFSVSITFTDNSILHVRENIVTATNEINYAYQWQTADHLLIHRWDNAHPVKLLTTPHHQHIGSVENIHPSEPMTLEMVLTFIVGQLSEG